MKNLTETPVNPYSFTIESQHFGLTKTSGEETHNIYESNAEWWESDDLKQYLFFADDDVSWYCVDRATSVYWVLDKPSGEQIESFDTLDGLLAKTLETALM